MKYKDTWDLESIFPGGTASKDVQDKLKGLKESIKKYQSLLKETELDENSAVKIKNLLDEQDSIYNGLGQAGTFIQMWHDAYMNDAHASVVMGQVMDLFGEMRKLMNTFVKKLVHISDEHWQTLMANNELNEMAFTLNELREQGERLLSDEEEALIADLNKDGLAAWSELYSTAVSIMTIPYTDADGKTSELSVGQAMNRMYADPDPAIRSQLF